MATIVGDFFIESNSVSNVSEEDYSKAAILVNAAKAFARNAHQCVYIIDYFRQNFLWVSDNMAILCGESTEKIMEMGYGFYVKYVPEKELQMLLEINRKGFELFEKIPMEKRFDYTISYDFHIINGRKQRLVHHYLTPVVLAEDGRIWLALCTISMAARVTPGNIRVKEPNSSVYYEYTFQGHKWVEKEEQPLSEAERDVLTLSAQGYTMSEIADTLCKSVDTIKAYKRQIFTKLDVRNISEALSLAINFNLI